MCIDYVVLRFPNHLCGVQCVMIVQFKCSFYFIYEWCLASYELQLSQGQAQVQYISVAEATTMAIVFLIISLYLNIHFNETQQPIPHCLSLIY